MHINFQHQQCREDIKILVNQTDIRFKLVQQEINMNFNQQLWLNKPQKVHKMVKIVKDMKKERPWSICVKEEDVEGM